MPFDSDGNHHLVGTPLSQAIRNKFRQISRDLTILRREITSVEIEVGMLPSGRAVLTDSSGRINVSVVTATELGYLDNARSNIQQQIDDLAGRVQTNSDSISAIQANIQRIQAEIDAMGTGITQEQLDAALARKQDTITGAATTITSADLTANRALISDANGKVAVSPVTSTELGFLDGVTSGLQNQLQVLSNRIAPYEINLPPRELPALQISTLSWDVTPVYLTGRASSDLQGTYRLTFYPPIPNLIRFFYEVYIEGQLVQTRRAWSSVINLNVAVDSTAADNIVANLAANRDHIEIEIRWYSLHNGAYTTEYNYIKRIPIIEGTGTSGGLTQSQVDARILEPARAGSASRWSKSKLPTDLVDAASLQMALRLSPLVFLLPGEWEKSNDLRVFGVVVQGVNFSDTRFNGVDKLRINVQGFNHDIDFTTASSRYQKITVSASDAETITDNIATGTTATIAWSFHATNSGSATSANAVTAVGGRIDIPAVAPRTSGGTGGLNQAQVDARVAAGVLEPARTGSATRWSKDKLPSDVYYGTPPSPDSGLNAQQVDARILEPARAGSTTRWAKTKLPSDIVYGANLTAAVAGINSRIDGIDRSLTALVREDTLQGQAITALQDERVAAQLTIYPPYVADAAGIQRSYTANLNNLKQDLLFGIDSDTQAIRTFELIETETDEVVHSQSWTYVGADQELEFTIGAQEASDAGLTGAPDFFELRGQFKNASGTVVATTDRFIVNVGAKDEFPALRSDLSGTSGGTSTPSAPRTVIGQSLSVPNTNVWEDYAITEDIETNREYQFIVRQGAFNTRLLPSIPFTGADLLAVSLNANGTWGGTQEQLGLVFARSEAAGAQTIHIARKSARVLKIRFFNTGYQLKELVKLPQRGGTKGDKGDPGSLTGLQLNPFLEFDPNQWVKNGDARTFSVFINDVYSGDSRFLNVDKLVISIGGFGFTHDWTPGAGARQILQAITADQANTITTNLSAGDTEERVTVTFHATGGGATNSGNAMFSLRSDLVIVDPPAASSGGLTQDQVDARVRAVAKISAFVDITSSVENLGPFAFIHWNTGTRPRAVVTLSFGTNRIAMTNLEDGEVATLLFIQDSTGNRNVNFPAAWKWPGETVGTIERTAGAESMLSVRRRGSDYYAILVKDFG